MNYLCVEGETLCRRLMATKQTPHGDNPRSTEAQSDDIELECINGHRWRAENVTKCPTCQSRYVYQISDETRKPATK